MYTSLNWYNDKTLLPFVAQFISRVELEDCDQKICDISTYLIPAKNKENAYELAKEKMEDFEDAYKNTNGKIVSIVCERIFSLDEIEDIDEEDGTIELSSFLLTDKTTIEDLFDESSPRDDIPILHQ